LSTPKGPLKRKHVVHQSSERVCRALACDSVLRSNKAQDSRAAGADGLRVAVLLSCSSFEDFFTDILGFSRRAFLDSYRNDWVWEYAEHLRRAGVTTTIVIPTYDSPGSVTTHDGFEVCFIQHRRAMRLYRRHPGLARSPWGRWVFEAFGALSLWPALRRLLSTTGADLLYVQEYWTGRYDVLALLTRTPLVGADHGGRSRRQVGVLKRFTFPRARILTTQTPGEAHEVRRRGGRPVPFPNPVDTDFFGPGPMGSTVDLPTADGRQVRLLHVARLNDRHKRTSDLLRAMALLTDDHHLDIVGTGPDEALLQEQCASFGLSDRVAFHGFVSDRDRLRHLYRSSHVLVVPSAHEARLLAALEAMACGLPVVLNDIEVFRALVDDGVEGRIVDTTNAEELALAIQSVVAAGDSMRVSARARVAADASWSACAPRLRDELMRAAKPLPTRT